MPICSMAKMVAPFAGAWIEIKASAALEPVKSVAPFAGAWIEIIKSRYRLPLARSHPSRVRGLK